MSFWPLYGVPVGALTVRVPAPTLLACVRMSVVSIFGVIDVALGTATTRGGAVPVVVPVPP